jgi:hypothetical protein
VPLNSPRLLIRLRVCRKSGTVPLNSPRLLIRHWIPSTGLHTDKILSYKRSLYPARHEQPTQYKTTKYYKIRDNMTSTGDASQEDSNRPHPLGTRRHQSGSNAPLIIINLRRLYSEVLPIISTPQHFVIRSVGTISGTSKKHKRIAFFC